MISSTLDLSAVRAFVQIAEMRSFTRAAESLGTTQATMSMKLKRLEDGLGCRLVERTPRRVDITAKGTVFLKHARDLLASHDRAIHAFGLAREKLTIGLSDHVAGPELPVLIARMNARDPSLLIEIRIGSSEDLVRRFEQRELDVILTRFRGEGSEGEIVAVDRFGWFAAQDWQHHAGDPIPIATMPEPCGVRLLAGQMLDEADVDWNEVFVGGGVAAISAAVQAGVGIAAMASRVAPMGVVDVGGKLGLPKLPDLPIVVHSRAESFRARDTVTTIAAAFAASV